MPYIFANSISALQLFIAAYQLSWNEIGVGTGGRLKRNSWNFFPRPAFPVFLSLCHALSVSLMLISSLQLLLPRNGAHPYPHSALTPDKSNPHTCRQLPPKKELPPCSPISICLNPTAWKPGSQSPIRALLDSL